MTCFYYFMFQSGGSVIGSLEMIGGLIGVMYCAAYLEKLSEAARKIDTNYQYILGKPLQNAKDVHGINQKIMDALWRIDCFTIVTWVCLIMSIAQLIVACLLIYGNWKKSIPMLSTSIWLVLKCILYISILCCHIFIAEVLNPMQWIFYLTMFILTLISINTIKSLKKEIQAEVSDVFSIHINNDHNKY